MRQGKLKRPMARMLEVVLLMVARLVAEYGCLESFQLLSSLLLMVVRLLVAWVFLQNLHLLMRASLLLMVMRLRLRCILQPARWGHSESQGSSESQGASSENGCKIP